MEKKKGENKRLGEVSKKKEKKRETLSNKERVFFFFFFFFLFFLFFFSDYDARSNKGREKDACQQMKTETGNTKQQS